MIELENLSKRYGSRLAVDGLTCVVRAGQVTGLVGPNGAGKSTTIRMIVGLDHPSHGRALVKGQEYGRLDLPLRVVGALVESTAAHPARRCVDHLRWLAASNRIASRRVAEVLELVGLTTVSGRRAGAMSLGMRQRLGIAAALLGDPDIVILDEPMNGLDPEGIVWIRELLTGLAAAGRTVLISSHIVAELAKCANHILIMGRGRLLADAPIEKLARRVTPAPVTQVRVDDPARLQHLLADQPSARVTIGADNIVRVDGVEPQHISAVIAGSGLVVGELRLVEPSLEEAYLALTTAQVDFAGRPMTAPADPAAAPERTPR